MSIEEFIIQDEKLARIAAGKNLQQIEKLFQKYISKVISLYQLNENIDLDTLTPQLKKEIEKLTKQLSIDLENKINSATKEQWMLAQGTATKFVETYFDINKLNKATQDIFRNNNLDNYMQARKSRLNQFKLSDRVWKYSKNFETNIIDSLEIALKNGDSAQVLARDIKQYLNEPEKLFRRVRDVKGQLHLSKNAAAYNPGQGVYRSAHKNALRLASTEINTYYKESENQRWQSMDFVVGFEIKRSNNVYDCGLCDSLKGRYPKSFLFTGWHPNCYSDDTEVMTNEGWKLFKDLNGGEMIFSLNPINKQPEWVSYVNYFEYEINGKMIHFHNKGLDLLVTPDHRMIYIGKSNSVLMDNKFAHEYSKNNGGLYRVSEYSAEDVRSIQIGNKVIDFDLFCEFMGYYLSDGSVSTTRNNQFKITKSLKENTEVFEFIHKLMSKMPFKSNPYKEGFYVNDLDFYQYLIQFGKSADKFIPNEILNSSPRQIEIFLNAFVKCDGSVRLPKSFIGNRGGVFKPKNVERNFFTSSQLMASQLGELLVKIGKRPGFRTNKTKGKEQQFKNGTYTINNDCYVISECHSKTATVFNKTEVDYKGKVYDIELEKNHIFYVRRNGKAVWGSNCRCYQIPILKPIDMFTDELKGAVKNSYSHLGNFQKTEIKEMPANFKEHLKEKADIYKGYKTVPYWVNV